jgi:glutathione S-transferase
MREADCRHNRSFHTFHMTKTPSTAPSPWLYGAAGSGHSYKVRLLLLLSRTPHIYQPIALDVPSAERPAAFVAASRFGEVPVLIDDGVALCQSNAILQHMAERTGAFAGARDERHTVLEWLFWETNRIGFSVPNLRFARRWARQPAEVLAYLRARALADLQTLDEALAHTEFLLPSGPTIADIACAGYLYWLDQAGIAAPAFSHVARWLNALSALPGWEHPDKALAAP